MTNEEYKRLEKAADTWYDLQNKKYKLAGIRPKYFLWGFGILFVVSAITGEEYNSDFFIVAALLLLGIFVTYLSYKYFPYFVSRREKHGTSAYDLFGKRIFMSFTMGLTSILFVLILGGIMFPKDSPSEIESIKEVDPTIESVLIESEQEPILENPILKMDAEPDVLYISPTIEKPTLELKKLPMLAVEELSTTDVEVPTTTEAETIQESPILDSTTTKKKRWRLFRKRNKEPKDSVVN